VAAEHQANYTAIAASLNSLDAEQMSAALATLLGVTADGSVRRGAVSTAAAESRTNAAYGLLTTPDRVSSVVVPTNGLLIVGYRALWKTTATGTMNAAIFLGANQLKLPQRISAPSVQEASYTSGGAADNIYKSLVTSPQGLKANPIQAGGDESEVTTGMLLTLDDFYAPNDNGGVAFIFAAAGTYDVSVQFKSATGLTVKDRHLWVLSLGF
jgi:hypothetical protein